MSQVWKQERQEEEEEANAICGHVPTAHAFPLSTWIRGREEAQGKEEEESCEEIDSELIRRNSSRRTEERFGGDELPLSFCTALTSSACLKADSQVARGAGGPHDFYSGAQLLAVAPIHHDGIEFGKEVSACAGE